MVLKRMDLTNPETLAEQAMLGNVIVPPVAPEPTVKMTKPAEQLVSEHNTKKFLEKAQVIIKHPGFRLIFVFIITCVILVLLNPPFVQVRSKNKKPIEKAGCSYKRVLVFATIVTIVVAAIPVGIKHKDKIKAVFTRAKGAMHL